MFLFDTDVVSQSVPIASATPGGNWAIFPITRGHISLDCIGCL
jgi:hypothetical protein